MKGDMNMKGILRRAGVPNEHWMLGRSRDMNMKGTRRRAGVPNEHRMLGRTCLEELEKDRESEERKKLCLFLSCVIYKLMQLCLTLCSFQSR